MAEYQIVKIRMSQSSQYHEHITDVMFPNEGTNTVPEIIGFIANGHTFIVSDGKRTVRVGVVEATSQHRAYIRTYADGVWTDNLLALPRF